MRVMEPRWSCESSKVEVMDMAEGGSSIHGVELRVVQGQIAAARVVASPGGVQEVGARLPVEAALAWPCSSHGLGCQARVEGRRGRGAAGVARQEVPRRGCLGLQRTEAGGGAAQTAAAPWAAALPWEREGAE